MAALLVILWSATGASGAECKGEFIRKFGSLGSGDGQFLGGPTGVSVDPKGNVWTIELKVFSGNARVQKFNSEGKYLSKFGSEGTGEGQFKEPQGIATDAEGNILVADTGNNRIQEFNPEGKFVRAYGKEGTGNGEFKKQSRPQRRPVQRTPGDCGRLESRRLGGRHWEQPGAGVGMLVIALP